MFWKLLRKPFSAMLSIASAPHPWNTSISLPFTTPSRMPALSASYRSRIGAFWISLTSISRMNSCKPCFIQVFWSKLSACVQISDPGSWIA